MVFYFRCSVYWVFVQLLSDSVIGDFLVPSNVQQISVTTHLESRTQKGPVEERFHCLTEFRFCKRLFKEKVHHNSGVSD